MLNNMTKERNHQLIPRDIVENAELYDENWTLRQLARRSGVSVPTIVRDFDKMGKGRRPVGGQRGGIPETFLRDYTSRVGTMADLAEKYAVKPRTLYTWLRKIKEEAG